MPDINKSVKTTNITCSASKNGYAVFGDNFSIAVPNMDFAKPEIGESIGVYERRMLEMVRTDVPDDANIVKQHKFKQEIAFEQLWRINQRQIYRYMRSAGNKAGLILLDSESQDFKELELHMRCEYLIAVNKYDLSNNVRLMAFAGDALCKKALSETFVLKRQRKNGGLIFKGGSIDGAGRAESANVIGVPSMNSAADDIDHSIELPLLFEIEASTCIPDVMVEVMGDEFFDYFKRRVEARCEEVTEGALICRAFFEECSDIEFKKGIQKSKKPGAFHAIKGAAIQEKVEDEYGADKISPQAFTQKLQRFKGILQTVFMSTCRDMGLTTEDEILEPPRTINIKVQANNW